MNTIRKLLRITGSIGLSCVCLTAEADPKTMTLEELKAFLKDQENQTEELRKGIDQEIKDINKIGAGTCPFRVDALSIENKKNGVKRIACDYFGVPCAIETIGRDFGAYLYNAIDPTDARLKYMNERVAALSLNLDKISEELTAEELKKLETHDKDRLLDGFVIRRITFDTILSSDFFDKNSCAKGKEWFSDRGKLEAAIDAYVKNVTILKHLPVRHIVYNEPSLQYAYDEMSQKMTVHSTLGRSNWGKPDYFIYKLSDEPLEQKRDILKKTLKGMLGNKNGKEKVILLLLLEEKTPPEYCLEWMDGRWAEYAYNANRMTLKFDSDCDRRFLSHEIGHYLQVHLGLRQTFKDYKNTFAKKLLLLEAPFENDGNAFPVPEVLRSLFKSFDKSCDNVPSIVTQKDLFMRWQLVSRWSCSEEISNILGIYFNQNTIYMCALSDICEQKYVRYGHNYCSAVYNEYARKCKEQQKEGYDFSNKNDRDFFKKTIHPKAAEAKPDVEVLKFLCELHGVSFEGIVNSFDTKTEKENEKLEAQYNVFRNSED